MQCSRNLNQRDRAIDRHLIDERLNGCLPCDDHCGLSNDEDGVAGCYCDVRPIIAGDGSTVDDLAQGQRGNTEVGVEAVQTASARSEECSAGGYRDAFNLRSSMLTNHATRLGYVCRRQILSVESILDVKANLVDDAYHHAAENDDGGD